MSKQLLNEISKRLPNCILCSKNIRWWRVLIDINNESNTYNIYPYFVFSPMSANPSSPVCWQRFVHLMLVFILFLLLLTQCRFENEIWCRFLTYIPRSIFFLLLVGFLSSYILFVRKPASNFNKECVYVVLLTILNPNPFKLYCCNYRCVATVYKKEKRTLKTEI